MKFRATILLAGKTATGVEVPEKIVTGLGGSKKPAVSVTINKYTYRSSIASMGGKFMLPISGEVRKNAGVEAGDTIDVEVALDTQPREVTVPADLAKALKANAKASQFFEGLSYSNKLRNVLAIEQAKTDETRQRRIAQTVAKFAEGKS